MFSVKPVIFICYGDVGKLFQAFMEAALDRYLKDKPSLKQCFYFIQIDEEVPSNSTLVNNYTTTHLSVQKSELEQRGYSENIRNHFPNTLSKALAAAIESLDQGIDISSWKMQQIEISQNPRLLFVGSISEIIGGSFIRFCIWNGFSHISDADRTSLIIEIAYLLPEILMRPPISDQANARAYASLWELETELQQSPIGASLISKCWLFGKVKNRYVRPSNIEDYITAITESFALLLIIIPEDKINKQVFHSKKINNQYFHYSTMGFRSFSWNISNFMSWLENKLIKKILQLDQLPNPENPNFDKIGTIAQQIANQSWTQLDELISSNYQNEKPSLPNPIEYPSIELFISRIQELKTNAKNDAQLNPNAIELKALGLFTQQSPKVSGAEFNQISKDPEIGIPGIMILIKALLNNENKLLPNQNLQTLITQKEILLEEELSSKNLDLQLQEIAMHSEGYQAYFKKEKEKQESIFRRIINAITNNNQKQREQRQKIESFLAAFTQLRIAFEDYLNQSYEQEKRIIALNVYKKFKLKLETHLEVNSSIEALLEPETTTSRENRQNSDWTKAQLFNEEKDWDYFKKQIDLLLVDHLQEEEDLQQNNQAISLDQMLESKLGFLRKRLQKIRLAELEYTGLVAKDYLAKRLSYLLKETSVLLQLEFNLMPDAWIIGHPKDVHFTYNLIGQSLQEILYQAPTSIFEDEIKILKVYNWVGVQDLYNQSNIWKAYRRMTLLQTLPLHAPDFDPGNNAFTPMLKSSNYKSNLKGHRLFAKARLSKKLKKNGMGMFFYQSTKINDLIYLHHERDIVIEMFNIQHAHLPLEEAVEKWFQQNTKDLNKLLGNFLSKHLTEWEAYDTQLLHQIIKEY